MVKRRFNNMLVLATRLDLPLIDHWLVQPEIRRWWGSPISTQIEMRLGIFCHDSLGRVFLIRDTSDKPVGLISIIHARATVNSRTAWPDFLPPEGWEIGILIGDKKNRRCGLGSRALIEAQKILFDLSDDPVFAWIEKENAASLATFSKLGYRLAYEPETASLSAALLQYNEEARREND